MMFRIFILLIALLMGLFCNQQKNYDHYFNSLLARDLKGNRFYLNQITKPVIIINFYSPTCIPCIEELKALHLIYEEVKKMDYQMFLAVEPNLERNFPDIPTELKNKDRFDEESFIYMQQKLQEEVYKRNIIIPIIIFEPPFRIDSKEIITGTPETLIFTTKPLMLRYNFIGPITTSQDIKEIQRNSRYQFFISLLKTIHQNLQRNVELSY